MLQRHSFLVYGAPASGAVFVSDFIQFLLQGTQNFCLCFIRSWVVFKALYNCPLSTDA